MSILLKERPAISVLASILNLSPSSAGSLAPQIIESIHSTPRTCTDLNPIGSLVYACSHIDVKSSALILPHLTAFVGSRPPPEIACHFLISAARIRSPFTGKHYLQKLSSSIDVNQLNARSSRLLFNACCALGIANRFDVARFCKHFAAHYCEILPSHFGQFLWQSSLITGVCHQRIAPVLELMRTSKIALSNRDLRLVVSSIKRLVDGRYSYRHLFARAIRSLSDNDVRRWEVIAVLTAAVRAGAYNDAVFSNLTPLILKLLPFMSGDECLQLVWVYASANYYNGRIFTETADSATKLLKSFSPGSVSLLIWSFASVAHFSNADSLYEQVLEFAEDREDEFSMKELCTVISSLASYSFISENLSISNRIAKLWHSAANRVLTQKAIPESSANDDSFVEDRSGSSFNPSSDSVRQNPLYILDQARVALIHNGCVLDHDIAERIATAAPPRNGSIKKQFMREMLIESLKKLGLAEDIRIDQKCHRSGITIPLSYKNVAIEVLIRSDCVDGLQSELNGNSLVRCKLLQRNGWEIALFTEHELYYRKEPFDHLRLIVNRLKL